MSQIESPKTGRLIRVGSKTFNDLLKDPQYRDALKTSVVKSSENLSTLSPTYVKPALKPLKPLSKPLNISNNKNTTKPLSPLSPKKTLKPLKMAKSPSMPLYIPTSPATSLKEYEMPSSNSSISIAGTVKRRSPLTKGWSDRSPKRGSERHQLKAECGDKCFLDPQNEKFPICASPKLGRGCEIDMGGVQSAYIRARQWNYPKVAEQAREILDAKLEIPRIPSDLERLPSPKPSLRLGGKMDKSPLEKSEKKKVTWDNKAETPSCGCGK